MDIRKKPATSWKIPLYKVHVDKEDVNSVSKVIKRGSYWAIGPEIEEFEKALAKYVGTDFCVTFNSGTSAGHAALLSTGVGLNDEIIIPSFTFIATANWVKMINSTPKFVDIEEETFGLDPKKIRQQINKKTKVIMPVHYAGLSCKINEIKKIADSSKKILIEDAAESLGATTKRRKIGTFGKLAVFSFAGNKVLTTGEGGAVTTNSKKLFEKLKLIRSHGRMDKQNYFSSIVKPNYVSIGYNWRMSSITAALGISQLAKIDKLIKLRTKHASYLTSSLKKHKQIKFHVGSKRNQHAYQLYSIRLPNQLIRNKLMEFLSTKGIMSKVFFYPVHKTNYYKKLGFSKNVLPITEKISNEVLSLPMYPGLKTEELRYIVESINEFFEIKS